MKAGQRLHEWAAGVKLGAPGNGFRARLEPRMEWKWDRIGATVMPMCPECGAVVGTAGMAKHEEWHDLGGNELVIEPDEDQDQDQEEQ